MTIATREYVDNAVAEGGSSGGGGSGNVHTVTLKGDWGQYSSVVTSGTPILGVVSCESLDSIHPDEGWASHGTQYRLSADRKSVMMDFEAKGYGPITLQLAYVT